MTTAKLPNIGPKSAAWLRQVGVRSAEDLAALGAVEAFAKVRRAGFKPSLNLLYSLEGALTGCHWQQIPPDRRAQLLEALEALTVAQSSPQGLPAGNHPQRAGSDVSTDTWSPPTDEPTSADK